MFKNKKKPNNQRGDTLVSIAFSIVAIGVTATIGYALISSAARQGRSSIERSQVITAVQAQMELLKAYMLHPDEQPIISGNNSNYFPCHPQSSTSSPPPPPNPVLNLTDIQACLNKIDNPGIQNPQHIIDDSKRYEVFCFGYKDQYIALKSSSFTTGSPTACAGVKFISQDANLKLTIVYIKDMDNSLKTLGTPSGDEHLFVVRAVWDGSDGENNLQTQIRLDPVLGAGVIP